ncbi:MULTISPECIES: TMEM175 family protein [unclassified Methanobrevibacter]|uniref:TMEM175 family protein n=1 Tax=unclassified Methanobrevibacter TaxID=2638681 RepID=UPI0039B8666B
MSRCAVCFIFVGAFCLYHHEYLRVEKLTVPFVWLNIIYLLCIAFIPFSSIVMGKYALFFEADLLFGVNIFLILTILSLMFCIC